MIPEDAGYNTLCVKYGEVLDPLTLGAVTPIYPSSAYAAYPTVDDGPRYPRYQNLPNQVAVSMKIARLEKGEEAIVTSSGMGAITSALLTFLKSGDHAVVQENIYGGTYHFITSEFSRFGIEYDFVRGENPADFAAAVKSNTRVIYIETPANPLLNVIDIRAIADIARKHELISMIDNTFATPINQVPIPLGIDVSLHSGTKYLNGHTDLCCGAIVSTAGKIARIRHTAINFGPSLNAYDCWLLERGMKTLGLRMERHNSNAMRLASWLEAHPRVAKVHYPGLISHPGHNTARKQMMGFGGMLSFELECDFERASAAAGALELIMPAVSLGGVESLITFPSKTSHAKMTREERLACGISDSLLRLSVGIEDADDLINDLEQALNIIR